MASSTRRVFSGYRTQAHEPVTIATKLPRPPEITKTLVERSSPGESPRWVPNIRISVIAVYRQGLRAVGLKAALSKAFPAIQNRKDLETRFYASQPRQHQDPTDFVYDLIKLQKKVELEMSEKALVDHIFVRLEPQVQDYVEVRNPQNTVQLLEVFAKFEERYSCKAIRGSRNSDNVEGRGWNSVGCLMLVIIQEIGEILKWCVDRVMVEMIIGVTTRGYQFNDRGYQFRNRGQNDDFSRGDHRNRGSSENFSRGVRRQRARLNVSKVSDVKSNQTQSINEAPIKLSNMHVSSGTSICSYFIKRDFYENIMGHESGEIIYIGGDIPKIFFLQTSKEIAYSDSKVDEGNLRVDVSETKLNVVANVSDNNTVESIIGEKVQCAIIRDLVLSSRNQLIEEQRTNAELGHTNRYLENPEDRSVSATICESWSRDFRLIEGFLFYAKYATSLGEMRVYIPKSLRNEIMREFHDKPLAGHFGRFKIYLKIRDVCFFPYMRKFIDQYVSTCHMCLINNYKNALPAGRLIPIVSNYPNEIVTLDLLGPYPVSRNLSDRLGIRHVKTVVYRPQANRTERVNRDLVQMIANYVNEQHDTWDQFLREFAYANCTAVNETTGKTPAELFLGRKLMKPFQ
ncbi:uncharacterized protein TNCV_3347301 [Trichonephila clavipes]|nr:uncharacterized protein TNCV_3347301 [Trichonephila clavipes]